MDGEFKNNINLFFKDYAFYIALFFVAIIVITLLIIFFLNKKKKTSKEVVNQISNDSIKWSEALGGSDNVIEVSAKGSRLVISLAESSKIDETKLKELGVTSIIKMSNKLTLVIEDNASKIEQLLKK